MEGTLNRRVLLGMGALTLTGLSAHAQGASGDALWPDAAETIVLWPGTPPGGKGVHLVRKVVEAPGNADPAWHNRFITGIGTPTLTVFRPKQPDGSAMLVIPGGGYGVVVCDNEGADVARRLCASGVTVFVLQYRLPAEGWANAADVPLQDAQRAMRLIRADAVRFGIDPGRMGVIGFSAGGHIAVSLITRSDAAVYAPQDGADALPARPVFAGLVYPVITMLEGTHGGSRLNLLGPYPSPETMTAYSCERHVTERTPPCFLILAADDDVVPYQPNGIAMFDALRAAKVPTELHVFQSGGHGFGIIPAKGRLPSSWPDLFLHWGYANSWFRDDSAKPV